ncbi:hypothetical protein Slin15195_G117360 [Septoria linicola]|uniref:Uncharacterized protein n=1 Tax=Septoria linicola TaxID=215465 RepID=A0A9Q9AYN2_9PEZI|nr:hypothetical protein Slin14017_G094370 [Septoria linicola]USW58417.1 hypothetical protein Slin15195_G117360 [Septoria linicola]
MTPFIYAIRQEYRLNDFYPCTDVYKRTEIAVTSSTWQRDHWMNPHTFHRFLDLPPELRNRIYETYFAEFKTPLYAPSQPPITKVSRQLRAETLAMFYGSSTFRIAFLPSVAEDDGSRVEDIDTASEDDQTEARDNESGIADDDREDSEGENDESDDDESDFEDEAIKSLETEEHCRRFILNTPPEMLRHISKLQLGVAWNEHYPHLPCNWILQPMTITIGQEGPDFKIDFGLTKELEEKLPTPKFIKELMLAVQRIAQKIVGKPGKGRLRISDLVVFQDTFESYLAPVDADDDLREYKFLDSASSRQS